MESSMKFISQIRKHSSKHSIPCVHNIHKSCGNSPIKSHNIQKNKILNNLSDRGHVYVLSDKKTTSDNFDLSFNLVGVGKATIFRCLCSPHDTELFSPIETQRYSGLKKQEVLYALKSLLYEYWKIHSYSSFFKSKRIQVYAKETEIDFMFRKNSNELEYCKKELDIFTNILKVSDYSKINSFKQILDFPVQFSISQSCCIHTDFNGKEISSKSNYYPFVHISIFPEENKTIMLFSWLKKDNKYYKCFFEKFRKMSLDEKLDRLNILLPMYCENIILSPRLFESWTEESRIEFNKIILVNIHPLFSTYDNSVSVNGWLGQVSFNLFDKF